jgi:hypothetical protein
MNEIPTHDTLRTTLQAAWDAHREFQAVYLNGVHDAMWAGWYAGFVIGRLGDFIAPSRLTYLLEEVSAAPEDWTETAAGHVRKALAAPSA